VLAEGFLVKGSGDSRVGLGECERDAVSHKWDFSPFCVPIKGRKAGPDCSLGRGKGLREESSATERAGICYVFDDWAMI
jgi:hypothetical protein